MPWKPVARGMLASPNEHGFPPPERCTIWGIDGEALQVATGDIRKAPFERSLLIASRDFDQLVTSTVYQSGTLKAWFAYRVSTRERRAGEKRLKAATFAPVWTLIQESAADWAEQYDRCSDRAEMWELGQPTTIIELQARVLYVLYRQVQDNPDGDLQRGLWLKWHPYYYGEAGKYLVLHRFLQYLNKHTAEGRAMDIYRRPSQGVQDTMRKAPWEETYGFQVHQMSQIFIENNAWDPRSLIGLTEAEGEEPEDSAEGIEYAEFILAGDDEDQSFEIAKNTILQDDGNGLTLFNFLHSLLEWPKGYVNIVGVSVDNGRGNDDTPVYTLDELRHFLGVGRTVFQLHAAGSGQAVNHVSQRDYRTHPIFKLEVLAAKLSCDGRNEAQLLFALIRRNHRHSKYFVDALVDLFTPLRDLVEQQWAEVKQVTTICEMGVNMDAETALDFRAWVGHLSSENEQKQARAYLNIVEVGSPILAHVVGALINLFRPEDGSWAELRGIKDVFDQVQSHRSQWLVHGMCDMVERERDYVVLLKSFLTDKVVVSTE